MFNKKNFLLGLSFILALTACQSSQDKKSEDKENVSTKQEEFVYQKEAKKEENKDESKEESKDESKGEAESVKLAKELDENLEKELDPLVESYIAENIFPSAQVLIAKDGKVIFDKAYGNAQLYEGENFESVDNPEAHKIENPIPAETDTLYDLASVTKVVATTQAIMKLNSEGKLNLEDKVVDYLPDFGKNGKEAITIAQLLTHTSGLPQWEPSFLYIDNDREKLKDYIYNLEMMFDDGEVHYSDFGFITLGYIVEEIAGESLDKYVENEIYSKLGMNNTFYKPLDRGVEKNKIAATSWGNPFVYRMVDEEKYPDFGYDTSKDSEAFKSFDRWRKHVLVGEVNDGNTGMASDGIAGHAGIYSNAEDLAILCQTMLNGGSYNGEKIYESKVLYEFRQNHTGESERGYGFELSKKYMGTESSESTFGHNGFTGTHISIDPENNMFIIFLTNKQNLGLDEEGSYKGTFDSVGEFTDKVYDYLDNK